MYDNSIEILGSPGSLIDLSLALIKKSDWHNINVVYESNHSYYREMKGDFMDKLAHTEWSDCRCSVSTVQLLLST